MEIIETNYGKQNKVLPEKVEELEISMNLRVAEKVTEQKNISVLSLFSGCGGMDLGLEGGFTVHKDSISEKLQA